MSDEALCDEFMFNYNINESNKHQNQTLTTINNFVYLPFFEGAKIMVKMFLLIIKFKVNILCMFENEISSMWSAKRLIDLGSNYWLI